MQIIITKNAHRNVLTCKRIDGTSTSENLGPDFPNHDLAHYVVESKFKMENGFYGKIKSGMSIQELSDGTFIRTLGPEAWVAEIMSRNLQSLRSGSCNTNEYIELVKWEGENMKNLTLPEITISDVEEMQKYFNEICNEWESLNENGNITLIF